MLAVTTGWYSRGRMGRQRADAVNEWCIATFYGRCHRTPTPSCRTPAPPESLLLTRRLVSRTHVLCVCCGAVLVNKVLFVCLSFPLDSKVNRSCTVNKMSCPTHRCCDHLQTRRVKQKDIKCFKMADKDKKLNKEVEIVKSIVESSVPVMRQSIL